jgi:PAS domain S-box-containing protein
MFKGWILFLFILGYLGVLFIIAYIAERREKSGRSIVSNPYVYSLSLAVYCTSWTFYGSVGRAATSGFSFLTIYLGPTLMAALWAVLLKKIIRIAKQNRITTISDFIGVRYGNSLFLSAFVTIVAVVGITPYLGLQIKAIISTLTILAGQTKGMAAAGWYITLILGVFAIIFGARRLDSSERHEGLIFAIAFESLIKLVAFLMVGLYVTYYLFDGFGDIFDRIKDSEFGGLLFLGTGTQVSYTEWASLLFLSMTAIMFLPRQFHVAVVENSDISHVSKAMWLFPLYLLLINIFVMPLAFGGLLLGGSQADADIFMLTIPLGQGNLLIALLTFIGGFAAATGMIIVESLALSTMVMNNLIMPTVYRFAEKKLFEVIYPVFIINIKRLVIMGCIAFGYFFAVSVGEFYSLVDIGLKSFEAMTIFAPSIILGLYWKRGNKKGALAGIMAGFIIWFYTLIVPAMLKAGIIDEHGYFSMLINSEILNPHALFGLKGLDRWSHSLFWGLFFNLFFYISLSIFTKQDSEEERQSLIFVDSYTPQALPARADYTLQEIEAVLEQYLGKREAREIIDSFLMKNRLTRNSLAARELAMVRDEALRILSGALGSAIATIILEDKLLITEKERGELSDSIRQMTDTLRLSRQELEEANRSLAYLKEFSENIIESAPVGIVTVDAHRHITYWNREMEKMTQISKPETANRPVLSLLPWIPADTFEKNGQREMELQTPLQQSFKINISPFTDPSGGFVVIFEDVTEKKKMEEQLVQAVKLASIGKLTAGISHEIGNPLASISSLVQELRDLPVEACSEKTFFSESLLTINSHIERIARIVRSLGDFARISTREKTLSNLPEILERTINLVRYDKRFKHIDLKTEIGEVPLLKVNPDQLQQVFLNLILNAFDVMQDGGTLAVSMRQLDGFIEIGFRDTGPGIDSSVIDKIFDPFFTTKPLGRGTGLGLSICYGIIREHSGTITVKSEKGAGTAFYIRLPAD